MTDTEIRALAWRELRDALDTLNRVPVQIRLGDLEAVDMLLGDVRRYLGSVALLLAETPDAAGYAELLKLTLTPPRSAAEAAYIERQASDASES